MAKRPTKKQRPKVSPRNDQSTSGLAIASLVLGIIALVPVLGVLPGVVGIVLGAVSLFQMRKNGQSGRGLAIAGIILSIIGLLFTVALYALLFYFLFFSSGEGPFGEIRVEVTNQMLRNDQAQLELFHAENGRYPMNLSEPSRNYSIMPMDHFMKPLMYVTTDSGASYTLTSAGPDKEFYTSDDITVTSK